VKAFFATVIVALLFFLALLLGAHNEQMVTISYFIAQGEFRLPVVLASVFLAGFLLCWLFAMYHITRMKLALNKAKRKLAKLESTAIVATSPEGEVKS